MCEVFTALLNYLICCDMLNLEVVYLGVEASLCLIVLVKETENERLLRQTLETDEG